MLIPTRFPLFAALLISKFAVIHEPADWRNRVRRDLDQVKSAFTRHFERIPGRNNADLVPHVVDQANFANSDPLVHPCLNWPCDGLPPGSQCVSAATNMPPVRAATR
jgi:hypothetical protein